MSYRSMFIWLKVIVFKLLCFGNVDRYFFVKSSAMHIAARMGLYEKTELDSLAQFVNSGDVVIDGGANFGVYTDALAHLVGTNGTVISVEPIPFVFIQLQKKFKKYKNVVLVERALSNSKDELIEMSVPYLATGLPEPALANIDYPNPNAAHFKVLTATLDSVAEAYGPVKFIKLDLEGHELTALTGGIGSICKQRPVIQFEENDMSNRWVMFLEFCMPINYRICKYSRNRFVAYESLAEVVGYNFYLVPAEHSDLV